MSLKESLNFEEILEHWQELNDNIYGIEEYGHVALSQENDKKYQERGKEIIQKLKEINNLFEDIDFMDLYSY